jgi:hypothetical protein
MPLSSTLLVMAKAPVAGRVKTRLCPPCRPEQAAAIAEAALADTLDAVLRCGAERRLLALDGEPGPWLPDGYEVVAQVGDGFADRLAAAWALVEGPGLQIGMDTPQVTPDLLDEGLAALVRADSAIGPALDGGWWAIGMRTATPSVFAGVPMSTEQTCRLQVAAMRAAGLDPVQLPPLLDIDTMDDARTVAKALPASRTAAAVDAVRSERASVPPPGSSP